MSKLKYIGLCLFIVGAGLSLQGCGKKGDPQAHCKAEVFPPSYGQ